MVPSLKGGFLPESQEDFGKLAEEGGLRAVKCYACRQPFSNANVRTHLGWRETQISGMCENCFDELFADPQEPTNAPPKA